MHSFDSKISPIDTMKKLGFEVFQDRETQRTIRNVHQRKDLCSKVAELAIDRGVYHFGNRHIRYYEVEIESKNENGDTALNFLLKELLFLF